MTAEGVIDVAVRKNRHLWDWRSVARILPRARRYVFTEEASRRLGEIIGACGRELIENRQFALPPYPVTYVELNIREVNLGIGRGTSGGEDNWLGFLVTGDRVRVFVTGEKYGPGNAVASAFTYVRGGADELPSRARDILPSHARDIAGANTTLDVKWIGAALRLGTTFHDLEDPLVLNSEWAVQSAYGGEGREHRGVLTMDLLRACYGELRVVLSALLVLNQPRVLVIDHVPARRGTAATRNRPYAAHSVVSIKIGERREYVAHFGHVDQRASPRRHEVSGHFVHHNCADGCEHLWPVAPEPSPYSGAPQWRCGRCSGTRTWREAFLRGDAARGFVTKSYEVDY